MKKSQLFGAVCACLSVISFNASAAIVTLGDYMKFSLPLFTKNIVAPFLALFFGMSAIPAIAATLNIDSSGQLLGASNVSFRGLAYDVSFEDGTCAAIFSGCNDASDFAFTNATTAEWASLALANIVFRDIPSVGSFDSDPSLTRGCGTIRCYIITPYLRASTTEFSSSTFKNAGYFETDGTPDLDFGVNFSTVSISNADNGAQTVFAIWTPVTATSPVPIPAAIWLFGSGLLGLVGIARKKA
jgi:hypothetical protein